MKLRHATTNFRALEPFLNVVEENNGYAKFKADGYMDLTIEKIWENDPEGNPVYSICHYSEQNGDAMRYPEMTFGVDWTAKTILPLSYRNDFAYVNINYFVYRHGNLLGYHKHWLHDGDNFLWTWCKNIVDQGFTADNFKTLSYEIVSWDAEGGAK